MEAEALQIPIDILQAPAETCIASFPAGHPTQLGNEAKESAIEIRGTSNAVDTSHATDIVETTCTYTIYDVVIDTRKLAI